MPDGTVLRAEQDADGSMHVHVSKADGTHVRVLLDSSFQVTSVQEFTGGAAARAAPAAMAVATRRR